MGLDFRISTSALEEVRNPVVLKKDAMNVWSDKIRIKGGV